MLQVQTHWYSIKAVRSCEENVSTNEKCAQTKNLAMEQRLLYDLYDLKVVHNKPTWIT